MQMEMSMPIGQMEKSVPNAQMEKNVPKAQMEKKLDYQPLAFDISTTGKNSF
jgi:hypothetical protein